MRLGSQVSQFADIEQTKLLWLTLSSCVWLDANCFLSKNMQQDLIRVQHGAAQYGIKNWFLFGLWGTDEFFGTILKEIKAYTTGLPAYPKWVLPLHWLVWSCFVGAQVVMFCFVLLSSNHVACCTWNASRKSSVYQSTTKRSRSVCRLALLVTLSFRTWWYQYLYVRRLATSRQSSQYPQPVTWDVFCLIHQPRLYCIWCLWCPLVQTILCCRFVERLLDACAPEVFSEACPSERRDK